jgi:protein dithiol:quinone oxidoreductase
VTLRAPAWLAAVAATALAAVGVALFTQYRLDMMPCAWCVLQRLVFVLIALAALVGVVLPSMAGRKLGASLVGLLALCGLAAAAFQHFVAAQSASCAMSVADRLMGFTGLDARFPEVFAAYASCADAKVDLFGLPYETYSATLFMAMALVAFRVWRNPR